MREKVLELLATVGDNLEIRFYPDGDIRVTVLDFVGFGRRGSEIYHKFDEDLVDSVEEQLEELALCASGDYYRYYDFEGFTVVWGYASFDV